HFEIIVAQMLSKVRVESPGDTKLLPGSLIDRVAFEERNNRLMQRVKVKDPGQSRFEDSQIVSEEEVFAEHGRLMAEGKVPPTSEPPQPASCKPQLLGISRVARYSASFLAAASIQDAAGVLAEAALAGKIDFLAGLHENVILGRLIPAGTGFC